MNTKLSQTLGRTQLLAQKHSPELLLGLGVVSIIGSVILAAKAGQKHSQVAEENLKELLSFAVKDNETQHRSDEEEKKELLIIKFRSAGRWVRLYGPAALTCTAGIVSIFGSHGVMQKRVTALGAAYGVLLEGFNNYRERVREDLGDESDHRYLTGIHEEEVEETTVLKNGKVKTKKVKKNVQDDLSQYAFFFDDYANEFVPGDPRANRFMLETQQSYWNEQLRAKGHVFLNQVLESLGIDPVPEGQLVGWVYNPDNEHEGDNYIELGIYDERNMHAVQGSNDVFTLDPNVDGIVWNLI